MARREDDPLKTLTERQERFVQGLLAGKVPEKAYEDAGYKRSRQHAHRMATRGYVRERLAELRGKAAEKAVVNRAWVLRKLRENAARAMQAEPVIGRDGEPTGEFTYNGSVANRALELLGKDLGMFTDKLKIEGSFLDELEPQELAALIGHLRASGFGTPASGGKETCH